MDKQVAKLAAAFAFVIVGALWFNQSCNRDSVTVPDPVGQPTISPDNRIGEVKVISPTPDPTSQKSYVTLGDGCAGTFCSVQGSADKLSLIATIPGRNDAASIYGEWFIRAEHGKCTTFGRAETFIKFPWCGEREVQCDASLGYGGGEHAGHIFTKVQGGICPSPTPTPSPSPCTEQWVEQPPVYGEWGECKRQPEITTSCTSPCHQYRTVSIYEKRCEETRLKREYQESKDCLCPTPPPDPGLCHVSNKGVKDEQVNLVLSWKQSGTGHELHLDPTKFCPPDHLGACDCDKAVADAIACGVPVAPKGFECKIEGTR